MKMQKNVDSKEKYNENKVFLAQNKRSTNANYMYIIYLSNLLLIAIQALQISFLISFLLL